MLELIFGVAILFALLKVADLALQAAFLAVVLAGIPFMMVIAVITRLLLLAKPVREYFVSGYYIQVRTEELCILVGAVLGFLLTYVVAPPIINIWAGVPLEGVYPLVEGWFSLTRSLVQEWGWPKTLLAFFAGGLPGGIVGSLLGHGAASFFDWFFTESKGTLKLLK